MSWVDEYFENNVKDIKSFIKYRYTLATNEDAADIAHDTYLQLKDAEARIGSVSNIRSYVYSALQNTSINFFRGTYTNKRVDRPVVLSVQYDPLEAMATKQMYDKAMEYIKTLPEQQRKAILLKMEDNAVEITTWKGRFYEGSRIKRFDSTTTFTESMGCSANTAKHHYFKARKKMLDFSKNFEYSFGESYVEDVHGFFEAEEEDT